MEVLNVFVCVSYVKKTCLEDESKGENCNVFNCVDTNLIQCF